MFAYSFQLYFDFSGYSDMAIGVSRLFGFQIPFNFNSPYKATSVSDFWLRWHISLSRFLRNYLYIPLGGNRSGPAVALPQPVVDHAARRLVAWFQLDLCHLGRSTRTLSVHPARLAHSDGYPGKISIEQLQPSQNKRPDPGGGHGCLVFFSGPGCPFGLIGPGGDGWRQWHFPRSPSSIRFGYGMLLVSAFIAFCMPNTNELFLARPQALNPASPPFSLRGGRRTDAGEWLSAPFLRYVF